MTRRKRSRCAAMVVALSVNWCLVAIAAAPAVPGVTVPAPPSAQTAVNATVGPSAADQFEHGTSVISLPAILGNQWSPKERVSPESIIDERFLRTTDNTAHRLTLKQVIYIALSNNPSVAAIRLGPPSSTEGVRSANGTFDPDLQATADQIKTVIPATTSLESGGDALSTKNYDWNFSLIKILASTNGTLTATFNNSRTISNNSTQTINPFYNSTLGVSLSQPLLRNFGWRFATLTVRLAESAQKQAQWQMAQQLEDFVSRVGSDYWGVVQGEENLQVAQESLKFNQDLVRQNHISVRVGTMAPLDLQEAQSATATAAANVYTAQAQLKTARVTLRQDVMLNPEHTFLPAEVEPADQPVLPAKVDQNEEQALETAVLYQPSLGGMREAIRTALMQVKFQENQLLPQVNLSAQIANTGMAGDAQCGAVFGSTSPNCFNPSLSGAPPLNGVKLPFEGDYGTVLNKLFNFGFYNYAIIFNYERPLDNALARSALAQTRVGFEQIRMQYRAALSQTVVAVESALANLHADLKRVDATTQATYYARQALHDEQVRFRVGMATTHDLLQYENSLVTAEGQEVQAKVDLMNSWLALEHAKGTLLRSFDVRFQVVNPQEHPWYATF
ncbi:MAG TPA: TolC family protein [Candidatus Binataceae bacterium]|nr:TolC family protein [Candidatus Binataceae bacterium]